MTAPPLPADRVELAEVWLVELIATEKYATAYFCGTSDAPTKWPYCLITGNPTEAVRFSRKIDAERVIRSFGFVNPYEATDLCFRASEHIFDVRLIAQARTQSDHDELPIDMVLYCPKCGLQHVDVPSPPRRVPTYSMPANVVIGYTDVVDWTNPPHRSHLCAECGHIWRPADGTEGGAK